MECCTFDLHRRAAQSHRTSGSVLSIRFPAVAGKNGGEKMMQQVNLSIATFIGIDAHTGEHTALAINRFEETKGKLNFQNTHQGIAKFLSWIPTVDGKNMLQN